MTAESAAQSSATEGPNALGPGGQGFGGQRPTLQESNEQGSGALAGVRVADFSRVLAGPFATMMLADLGADVIKIESPEGDGTRQWHPPLNRAGQSTYFSSVNRGKRSVACDLKSPAGRAQAWELATTADVVIENFKPGQMASFGLEYARVARENPGVVYCSISGFGSGEGKDLPGYDLLVQAVGGLMSVTGHPDDEGGQPTKVGVALVDVLTGLNAVIGIQAALRARDSGITRDDTGVPRGQFLEVTLLGSLLAALSNQSGSTAETGISPTRLGNAHPSIAPYETLAASDQQIAVAVGTDAQFRRLCTVLGREDLGADQRFRSNPERVAHRGALRKELESTLRTEPAAVWIERLTRANVPAGRVNTIGQAISLAESLGLAPIVETEVTDSAGHETLVRTIASPIRLDMTPAQVRSAPPKLGEHDGATWLPTTKG